jgi:hypothetical protein
VNPPTGSPPRRRRPLAQLVLLLALAWIAAIGLVLAWLVHRQFVSWGEMPVHVVVNGREVISGVDFGAFGPGHLVAIGFGLLLALLVVAGIVSLGLLLGLGLPLLVIAAVLLALALPAALLLLPLWLLWLLLRRLLR